MPDGSKVFSINDFKEGLDVRKSELTAPGGTLRILENAVLDQGGEIQKRMAFVKVATMPSVYQYIFGQGGNLHVFGIGTGSPPVVPPGTCPVPITPHLLPPPAAYVQPLTIIDCEAFDDQFQVIAQDYTGQTFIWYGTTIVTQVGGANSHGTYSRTYKTKMYRIDGQYLRFSGVNAPLVQDPASTGNPGAGFTDMAINDPDGENLQGMEIYYGQVAVFARLATQIWTLDPDPTQDNFQQILRIGTVAPHSILQFGTGDVLFLSDSGVRSLKALYVNLAASVSDVGSPIDLILIPIMRANPTIIGNARAIIQPIQGRYWLYLIDTIYVLSYFAAGNITAWSTFKPEFTVQQMANVAQRIFLNDPAGNIYCYGGPDQQTYDSCKVTVRTPHHAIDAPTTNKRVQSVDVMCEGAWSISIGMLPNNTDAFELVANLQDNTFGLQSIPFAGYGTHVGIEMVHQAPGPALLAAIHLNIQEGWTK